MIAGISLHRVANSIVTRLILLGIVIVLLGATARYLLLANFLREDLEKVVGAQQVAFATYVARDVDYKVRQRQAWLGQLALTLPPALLHRPAELRAWLGERHVLQPLFSQGLFVVDRSGAMLSDYPARPERAAIAYGERDYVRAALTGQASIGRPVAGRIVGEPVLPMAVPIRSAGGEVSAVLVGVTALNAPGFLDLLAESRIGESGSFLLISPRDQLFVAASNPAMVLKPTPPSGVNPLHDRAMAGYRGSGITVNAQGVEEVSAMASVPSTGWFVVARLPTAEAFATVQRTQRYVLRHTAVVVLVFLVLALGGLYGLFRPLFRAADYADRMSRDELPLEPLPVFRPDEVGHLTEAFNRLLAKLRGAQDELVRLAHHDSLTGLPNRGLLADRMRQVLARAQRCGTCWAILFLDLDGFKAINDTHGHEVGDEALLEVARRLSAVVREADTLARIGGDEFVIVIGDLASANPAGREAAEVVAAKCIAALASPMDLAGRRCTLGVSIGIALGDGRSLEDSLLSAADGAMYRAKQAGRNRLAFADDGGAEPGPPASFAGRLSPGGVRTVP